MRFALPATEVAALQRALYVRSVIAGLKKRVKSCFGRARKWLGDPRTKPIRRRFFLGCGGLAAIALFFAIALVVVGLIGGYSFLSRNVYTDVPSKSEMERKYRSHEVSFDRLVIMLNEDEERIPKFYIDDPQSSTPPEGISEDRWLIYRELFEQIGLWNLISPRSKIVHFDYADKRGRIFPVEDAGIAFIGDDKIPPRSRTSYDKIVDHWYYFHSSRTGM